MEWLCGNLLLVLIAVMGVPSNTVPPAATNQAASDPTGQTGSFSTAVPTAADNALQVALRQMIDANYRLGIKQLDATFSPDQTIDDLAARRDAAADALARLLPASYGRQGVLDLFDPEQPLTRWQDVRQLFSHPDHWLCVATADDVINVWPSKTNHLVQVVFGEIDSRSSMIVKTWNQSAEVQVIRLKQGASSKPIGYLSKIPQVAEALDASTVVVHVDHLQRVVRQYEQAKENLPTVDFEARDAAIRLHYNNDRTAFTGMFSQIALRASQQEKLDQAAVENNSVFEAVAGARVTADPDFLFALTHCGANIIERVRAERDRVDLCIMAEQDAPLIGLSGLVSNAGASRPLPPSPVGPSAAISYATMFSLAEELAEVPAISTAVAAAPLGEGAKPSIDMEALLQAWNAPADQLHRAAAALEDVEYARSLITLLRFGAKAGVKIPPSTADRMILLAKGRAPNDERLTLEIGILYFYQRRDDLAMRTLTPLIENTKSIEFKADALDWVADLQVRAGKLEAAVADVAQSVDLTPRNTGRLAHYGYLLAKAGDTAKAADTYNRYLAIDSTSSQATDIRQRLAALNSSTAMPPAAASQP